MHLALEQLKHTLKHLAAISVSVDEVVNQHPNKGCAHQTWVGKRAKHLGKRAKHREAVLVAISACTGSQQHRSDLCERQRALEGRCYHRRGTRPAREH